MKNKLTLAITGHRDMVETEKLREEVNDFLDTLLQNNLTKEIVLLSPLADGADRFVAELFLAKRATHPNLKLYVPMPFTEQRYLEDFDEVSKEVFLEFLKSAQCSFTVPSKEQQSGYETLGYYVVDNSDILLAIWDKTFNSKKGGTGEVVAYAERQGHKVQVFSCTRLSTEKS